MGIIAAMKPTPDEAGTIESFVREGLGCGCPAEVFADIRLERSPETFTGLPIDCLVRIGGRLLIGVCARPARRRLERRLSELIRMGRQLRDRDHFNRFRLVVTSDQPGETMRALSEPFSNDIDSDDRLHLHVVRPAALPRCLK
jgi:hypothetical protein